MSTYIMTSVTLVTRDVSDEGSPHHPGIKRILSRRHESPGVRDSGSGREGGPPCLLPSCYCHMHAKENQKGGEANLEN